MARHARGIVLRDRGLLEPALVELRLAVRLARRSGDVDRESDVRATLGSVLALAGRTAAGLEQLDRAVASVADPVVAAKILVRRSYVRYQLLGQPREALDDLALALPRLRAAGDRVWEARTLNLMGLSHMALGQADRAAAAVEEAERIYGEEGQLVESVVTLHNRGGIAFCQGNLPLALRLYDDAAERYAAVDEVPRSLVSDRCEAMLTAGLAHEAVELVSAEVTRVAESGSDHAKLLLDLAMAELADHQPGPAVVSASRAWSLFTPPSPGVVGPEGGALPPPGAPPHRHARQAPGRPDRGQRRAAGGPRFRGRRARLPARRQRPPPRSASRRRTSSSTALPSTAADPRGWCASPVGTPGRRTASWPATGAASWSPAGVGSKRSTSTAAPSAAPSSGRWRPATATSCPRWPCGTPPRAGLAPCWPGASVGARPRSPSHRSTHRTTQTWPGSSPHCATRGAGSCAARADGSPTATRLDADRARLEAAIRRRTHHLAGGAANVERFDTERLLADLDGTTFVELVEVDHGLHALVVARGRVRRFALGTTRGRRTGRELRPLRPATGGPRKAGRPGRRGPSAGGRPARGRRPGAGRRTRRGLADEPSARHPVVVAARPGRRPGERGAVGDAVAAERGQPRRATVRGCSWQGRVWSPEVPRSTSWSIAIRRPCC